MMFDHVIRIAAVVGAAVLTDIAVTFFGGLALVVLTTCSVVPTPY